MNSPFTFCVTFSGLTLRFVLPAPITLPEEFTALRCDDPGSVDAEYEFCLLDSPLRPEGTLIHTKNDYQLYQTDEGWLRIYSSLAAEDGCQVACFLRYDGKHKLYYPASTWHRYTHRLRCLHLMGGEFLLMQNNAFLLHSSVVLINGKTVLFSGPSGAGKSTQAALWANHLGAKVLNGDRCVVMQRPDGFYGGGSLWAGTSGIYHREQAPIAGIFLLGQAPENRIQRLGSEAFSPLYTQTILNSWDPVFMNKLLQLYTDFLAQVPVYRLDCRPDASAVELAYHTLFN